MFHGRKLTMKPFSLLLLDEDNILLFYIKKAPLFKRKPSKMERNSEPISPSFTRNLSSLRRCGSAPSPSLKGHPDSPARRCQQGPEAPFAFKWASWSSESGQRVRLPETETHIYNHLEILNFCIYIRHTRPDPTTNRISAIYHPLSWRDQILLNRALI